MATPHNQAEKGDFAEVVLMPGDPLRAKLVAETYLEEPRLVNQVRGILGYTGTYKGKPVSVMASGMGMPSIGIYSYELFSMYGVRAILRIGSAGAYSAELDLGDVVLASSAYSESSFAKTQNGDPSDTMLPSEAFNALIEKTARETDTPITVATIHSSDIFYGEGDPYAFRALRDEKGCVCVEMESFALFHNARVLGKDAACLLTISDSLETKKLMSAEERQNSFHRMMRLALDAAAAYQE